MAAADRVIHIERTDDERVADYQALREADLAGRRDAFIAESEVVVRVLLKRGRFPVRSVFLATSRVTKLADALESLPEDVPIYTASQAVLSEIVGFRFHRGVVASGQRTDAYAAQEVIRGSGVRDPKSEVRGPGSEVRDPKSGVRGPGSEVRGPGSEVRGPEVGSRKSEIGSRSPEIGTRRSDSGSGIIVVLEGLTNHDNVGGIFRNAAAFGADAVLLDSTTCDPLYRKAIRVSAGASLFLPWARTASTAEAITLLQQAGYLCVALTPRADAVPLHALFADEAPPEKVALFLGSEGPGLTDASMDACDRLCRVDIDAAFDSLNVATTSGIALHAMRTRMC
jgi:tRNA G18 (ribose-2'-O)-methylase SpoU